MEESPDHLPNKMSKSWWSCGLPPEAESGREAVVEHITIGIPIFASLITHYTNQ